MKIKFLQKQDGVALVAVLALMALTVPLVTAGLTLASTLNVDSRVKIDILKRQYAAIAGSQYALYQMVYAPGYFEGLQTGIPDTSTITINGETVTVTVTLSSGDGYYLPSGPTDNSRNLQASKVVSPSVATPNTQTTFAYTITVENMSTSSQQVTKITDDLPPGFDYVSGSTTGITTANPNISNKHNSQTGQDYKELSWNISSLQINLQPGQTMNLTFSAQASVNTGNYCNEVWADPGGTATSSGLTAKVVVGSPANSLCPGEAIKVTKSAQPGIAAANILNTFTYTITLLNFGTEELNLSGVTDLLPPGFLYENGSTSGPITTSNPNTTMQQGQQRLTWSFNPRIPLSAGQTKTLTFRATAQVDPGEYWNEVWVSAQELAQDVYTWPMARVRVMSVLRTEVTNGYFTISSEVWKGSDSFVVTKWNMSRH